MFVTKNQHNKTTHAHPTKTFSKHTATTKKFLYNIKKQHTNKTPQRQTSFKPQSPLFTQCHNSISATKNTAPATHHNTKLYIIYIMRLLCAALCTCTPTIKNTYNARKQSAHKTTPSITHHKVRPNPTQKQTAHPRAHNKKNTHHTLQQLRPRRPAQTIHNTHKKHKKRHKKTGTPAPFFIKIKHHILYLTLCYF